MNTTEGNTPSPRLMNMREESAQESWRSAVQEHFPSSPHFYDIHHCYSLKWKSLNTLLNIFLVCHSSVVSTYIAMTIRSLQQQLVSSSYRHGTAYFRLAFTRPVSPSLKCSRPGRPWSIHRSARYYLLSTTHLLSITCFRPLFTVERLRMWGSRWYSQSLKEGGLNDIHRSSPKTKVKARVLGGQGSSVQIQHDPAHDAAPRRPGDGSKWVLMWPGR